jgi:hypothetical protein
MNQAKEAQKFKVVNETRYSWLVEMVGETTKRCFRLTTTPKSDPSTRLSSWLFGFFVLLFDAFYAVKKVKDFPVPCGDQTLPGRSNLIIPGQGEFGKWHPGWGREKSLTFFTV